MWVFLRRNTALWRLIFFVTTQRILYRLNNDLCFCMVDGFNLSNHELIEIPNVSDENNDY